MQRSRAGNGGFGANGAAYKRQRQTRPASRYDEEGSESYVRTDLSKLKVASLRKYVRAFDLQGVNPLGSKEDLLAAVSKHYQSMVVDEKQVLQDLVLALKKGQTGGGR